MATAAPHLASRLDRLERRNRRLTVTIVAVGALLLLGAASQPDTVRASKFELVDAAGRVRATLFADDEAAGLYILDESGTTRIGIAQFAHGGGGVALHGPDSKGAAVLYLKQEGSLRFFDASGKVTRELKGGE